MEEITLTEEDGFERSSGNVFADLGLPDPEGLMAQAQMIHAISLAMKAQGVSRAKLGKLVGLESEEVASLLKGPRDEFPLRRLAAILNALGQDVTITIRERPQNEGRAARILVETA